MKSNVVIFPKHRERIHSRAAPCANELRRDFLSIANYLDISARDTPEPKWTSAIASELRRIVRKLDDSR